MSFTPPLQSPNFSKPENGLNMDAGNPKIQKYTSKYHEQGTAQEPETIEQRTESMKKVLRHLQSKRPFEELSFEEKRILKECYDAGYFEGVAILEMISGRIVAEYRHEPRLTLEGLQFLNCGKSASNLAEQDERREPSKTHAAKGQSDVGKQSLHWTKASVIATIIIGLLSIASAALIAWFL